MIYIKDRVILKDTQKDDFASNKHRAVLRYKKALKSFGDWGMAHYSCIVGTDYFLDFELVDDLLALTPKSKKAPKNN